MELHRNLINEALVMTLDEGPISNQNRVALTKNELAKIRARAIRRGVWFRVLSRAERAYMGLTIRVVDRVRSHLLANVLVPIIRKLLDAMRSRIVRLINEVGRPFAQKLGRIAQDWGNVSAARWGLETGFIQYLAVTYMNTHGI